MQKGVHFSLEESSSHSLPNQNEARLENVKLCSEQKGAAPAAQFCSTSLLWCFPEDLLHCSSSREKVPQSCIHRASLIPAALWLLQGIWRLGHKLKITFFDSLRLYINCLEDSCCSLLQQDLGHLSAGGREGNFAILGFGRGVQPDLWPKPACSGPSLLPVPEISPGTSLWAGICIWGKERRDPWFSCLHVSQGAGESISRAFFLWPYSLSAPAVTG